MDTKNKPLSVNRLSIQKRLPLLICVFLLFAIVIYGFANYYSLKKATLTTGRVRLKSLTGQISTMFGQSAQFLVKVGHASARNKAVIQSILSDGKSARAETLAILDKLHRDSTWVSVELLDANLKPVLRSDKSTVNVPVNLKDVISSTVIGPDSSKVGRIYNIKGTMYYPIISPVVDKKQTIGYIIGWQLLRATPQGVTQLSQLMGSGAVLYIENANGGFWTNMISPVKGPPINIADVTGAVEYTNPDGKLMMARAQAIAHTDWLAVIEFSEDNVMAGVSGFMKWIIVFGVVLTAVGILSAWIMSRNITRPLNQLTIAATAISQGDYSLEVNVDRNDELGELANAFNIMSEKVHRMHQELESKVMERTAQLEISNKELEAFSYSVSHDLRTPLRAVSGYSIMLKEDYENKLDTEGDRIINNIISNTRMMGQLIDELLAFSRLGRKELAYASVDMHSIVNMVFLELLQNNPDHNYKIMIDELPPCNADPGLMKQVLINLIGNALKYSSKRDHPEISVGHLQEGEKLIYYVKDNGVGFDMAYANKLFGVFQRLHSQEEFEGTGVGLALVKRIIDKHKGEIWAEGKIDDGAIFYFSLPK